MNNNNRRHGDIFWLFVTLISNFSSSLPIFLILSKRLQGIQLQRNRDKPAIKISSQIPSRRVQSSNTAFIFSQILRMQAPSTSGHQYRRTHSMPYSTHPNLAYSSYQTDVLTKTCASSKILHSRSYLTTSPLHFPITPCCIPTSSSSTEPDKQKPTKYYYLLPASSSSKHHHHHHQSIISVDKQTIHLTSSQ